MDQTPPEKMTAEEKQKHLRTLKYVVDICEIVPEAKKVLTSFLDDVSLALSHLEGAQADKGRIDGLRALCGYIEAGEGESVSIGQDDATKDWILSVGKRWWHARSFRGVIDSAMAAQTEGERP